MKTIAAGTFKAKCLQIMDDVHEKRESVLITKHGKPVARLIPIEKIEVDPIFGFLKGKGTILGDIVSPAIPLEDWERIK